MLLKSASMIWRVFTTKFRGKQPIFAIIFGALVFRLSEINKIFPFDFDQQVPALAAYDFFVNHKLTLIGQELSFQGFFLGPLHNWIQFIPYFSCNLLPDCVPYFFTILSVLTLGTIYLVLKKIFDNKIALLVCFTFAFSFAQVGYEIGVSSNFFLLLSSLVLLYCANLYLQGKNFYAPLGVFVAGVATVNFNPVFIFSTIAYSTIFLIKKPKKLKIPILCLLAFAVNFLPLFIFDIRHNHLILNGFSKFAGQNTTDQNIIERLVFTVGDVQLPFYSNFLFQSASTFPLLITFILLVAGILSRKKSKDRFALLLPLWIVITTIGFTLYRGQVQDYYFLQSLLPFTILVAKTLKKNNFLILIFAVVLFYTNINQAIHFVAGIHYQIKKEAAEYILNDTGAETFNVYYDMPSGLNTGYDYLFKAMKHEPQEGGKFLYILALYDPTKFDELKYRNSFPDKNFNVKTFDFLHVVSIK